MLPGGFLESLFALPLLLPSLSPQTEKVNLNLKKSILKFKKNILSIRKFLGGPWGSLGGTSEFWGVFRGCPGESLGIFGGALGGP